jgi:(p)ppGpp synthase/HD superfamily hydrolase
MEYHARSIPILNFAIDKHFYQKYGDRPYYYHLLGVENIASELGASDEGKLAALLHDVVEDTDATFEDVEELAGSEVREIVELLTNSGESYEEYMTRLLSSGNRDALIVKLSDSLFNFSGDKSHMTEEKRVKLQNRYAGNIQKLLVALMNIENERASA